MSRFEDSGQDARLAPAGPGQSPVETPLNGFWPALLLFAASVIFIIGGSALHATAQAPKGAIQGQVIDSNGKALAGLQVTLDFNSASGEHEIENTVSSSDGSFQFQGLAQGSYTVRVICPSCDLTPKVNTVLKTGQTITITLVAHKPARNVSAPAESISSSSSHRQVAKKSGSMLGDIGFDQKPVFKAAAISSPEAGGGYSNSASVDTGQMVTEYLAPQEIGKFPELDGNSARNIEQQAQSDPTEEHLNRWGNLLLRERQYLQAVKVFTEGVQRFPRSERLRTGLGVALSSTGKYAEAVQQFTAATEINPSAPQPYIFLGQALILEKVQNPEARKRLEHFAKMNPQNSQALYYDAMSLWAEARGAAGRSRLNQVEALLKRAAGLDPSFGQAPFELGILYEQEGRTQEALREYQAAARATPNLAAAHYRLSRLYLRMGNREAAQQELNLYHKTQAQTSVVDSH
jgi:tetratricopeptide (TPR) repeat protein